MISFRPAIELIASPSKPNSTFNEKIVERNENVSQEVFVKVEDNDILLEGN